MLFRSEMAVAGGANLSLVPEKYRQLSQGRFLSTDGKCRSFGADGDGYVPGEGVGAILLKPLDMALRDGNRVLGVIRGTAINHGGRSTGYTVPSPKAQADVIVRAFKLANLTPQDIDRIECHGTGTSLGDPIEIAGLTEAFEQLGRQDGTRWPVSSAKSNIGHLEAAAGIAALGKVLLELEHETMAPSLHAIPLNPNIQWDAVPFTVQTKRTRWKSLPDHTRRASISSFGAGGSNAHIIMEEAPPTNATREQNDTPMQIGRASCRERV